MSVSLHVNVSSLYLALRLRLLYAFLSCQMVVVPVVEPRRVSEGIMGAARDNPPLSVSPVIWSTPEQGPTANHAPEHSGNGEATFGVLVPWMLFILSLLELGASPIGLPLILTSILWSLRKKRASVSASPGLLEVYILSELCSTLELSSPATPPNWVGARTPCISHGGPT